MKIGVVIPCYNEELTVKKVVKDVQTYLPEAAIYVFDNASHDATARVAKEAGATVVSSPVRGKGNVIRHAFRILDEDILVMTDGDDTYPMEEVRTLIAPITQHGADMVVGTRLGSHRPGSFRRFHLLGNRIFSALVSRMFGEPVTDMLSGFRAFSRDFYQLIPLHSKGFEIETDLTLQAISKGFTVAEVSLPYRSRPDGSHSKLKTFSDGFRILKFILVLAKNHRPLPFFLTAAGLCFVLGALSGIAPVMDYIQEAYVRTVPRAVLAASLMVLSAVFLCVGLILDSQIRYFNEQFHMMRRLFRGQDRKEKASLALVKTRTGA